MAIELNNVYLKNLSNLNVLFLENKITALIGSNGSCKTEIMSLISGNEDIVSGIIKYDAKEISTIELKKNTYYLKENCEDMLFNININEDIKYYLGNYDKEKLFELFKSFNLDCDILEKNYIELSCSEIKKILLIIGILSNCKILALDNPILNLDNKSIGVLIKYLKKLKRENKIIIVSSYNSNFLLEISDKIIVIDNKKILQEGNKFDILSNEKLMKKINFEIPNILNFIKKTREFKNIKLNNRDNINDLIKDIYRNAK